MSTNTYNVDTERNYITENVRGGELVFEVTSATGETKLVDFTVIDPDPMMDEFRKRNLDPDKYLKH